MDDRTKGLRKEFQKWYTDRAKKGHIPLFAIEYWWLKKINKLLKEAPLLK